MISLQHWHNRVFYFIILLLPGGYLFVRQGEMSRPLYLYLIYEIGTYRDFEKTQYRVT